MSIQIHIPTPMRPHAGGEAVVEVQGGTVQAALNDLGVKYKDITAKLFDNGQVRRFVNVYLNDEDIRYTGGVDTALKAGDVLDILPALAGGS
jgi:molybdopterin converting factor small subunit